MLTRLKLHGWLPIVVVTQLGCFIQPRDPPAPRNFQTAGPSLPPASCESDDVDDACTRCLKRSCCYEIAACTGACRPWFELYQGCLYTDGAWSGYGTTACKDETGMARDAAVLALVDCFSARCSTEEWCGTEPRAVFSFPPPSPTADFSAAQFFENYCNGCHTPGRVGPTGEPISQFTSNAAWTAPLQDQNWFESIDYAVVVSKKDVIACGVKGEYLPSECSTLPSVRAGFFTKPAKFPPSGIGGYASCPYTLPNGGCPQPTPFERARLLSWIADGAL